MRHNKKINHLGRTKAHRDAMLANMASSLIRHKRIFTTTAKAKSLRKYVEPLITKSKASATQTKEANIHARRIVFASLQDKYAVKILFSEVAEKVGERPGGYTRIIKTGNRLGDNASMCFIELVDFNENMLKETAKKPAAKTRRSRRKSSAVSGEETTPKTQTFAAETEAVTEAEQATETPTPTEAVAEISDASTDDTETVIDEPETLPAATEKVD
jgi:large subunit ribosomal protein L17